MIRGEENLRGADTKNTKMSGTDLRGSDLSNLTGPASLHGAKVTEIQLRQLSEVMIRDVDFTIAESPL
ncbi:pentapeptide repeat-containing protein [Nocardiopsis ganjiahuensis]|uniref:pentapeptide repeat-containing protein n=1 Tax=Nocardiopsis ganjiahuensis TaxID=239984 RepID=UPI000363C82C|nr:pentapeptide repeat-containing protein [Nocardiopsis ganjiahuensis]